MGITEGLGASEGRGSACFGQFARGAVCASAHPGIEGFISFMAALFLAVDLATLRLFAISSAGGSAFG